MSPRLAITSRGHLLLTTLHLTFAGAAGYLKIHRCKAAKAESARRRRRDVDHPSGNKRAAIRDRDSHRLMVPGVGDEHFAAERQAAMGSSQRTIVESHSTCCRGSFAS